METQTTRAAASAGSISLTGGLSRKIYLELPGPTELDSRSGQERILEGLEKKLMDDPKTTADPAKFAGDNAAAAPKTGAVGAVSANDSCSEISGDSSTASAPTDQPSRVTCSLPPLHIALSSLRQIFPLADDAGWKITASLAFDGNRFDVVRLEAGDTSSRHFGYAIDLGSTTVAVRLIDMNSGEILCEDSAYNDQIQYGTDILTRIFACTGHPEVLEKIRCLTVNSIVRVEKQIAEKTGIQPEEVIETVVSANTTMVHFLIGMDPFCVFQTPYAIRADKPGFFKSSELGLCGSGYTYIFPSKSNYLGGDIISGMIATELYKKDEMSAFFDIGTNGELVLGNKEMLLCGAGAAGPALEGGSVKTGMRAAEGAVDSVRISDGEIHCHTIGDTKPLGICGSGIVDLISELFLNGWVDFVGHLNEEKSPLIHMMRGGVPVDSSGASVAADDPPAVASAAGAQAAAASAAIASAADASVASAPAGGNSAAASATGVSAVGNSATASAGTARIYDGTDDEKEVAEEELAVEYAPGLYFYQSDIQEFLKTKAAAATMVEIMLQEAGLTTDDLDRFYVSGAFGHHMDVEAAVTIGMYPDMDRSKLINAGNTSMEGANVLLLHRDRLADIDGILERMEYIQYGAIDNFLEVMQAAEAIPHTDMSRYPSVLKKLAERQ